MRKNPSESAKPFLANINKVEPHSPRMPQFVYNNESKMYETATIEQERYSVLKSFALGLPLESKVHIGFDDFNRTLSMDLDSFVAFSNNKSQDFVGK